MFNSSDSSKICVSKALPSIKAIVPIPIYFTTDVWELCQAQPDPEELIWAICVKTIGKGQVNQSLIPSLFSFSLAVGKSEYIIFAKVGITDLANFQPSIITVGFPNKN